MSDATEEPRNIGLNALVRFLRAKRISDTCELCGNDGGWVVGGADNEGGSRLSSLVLPYFLRDDAQNQYSDMLMFGVPLITTACGNCGNTRLFSRSVVLDWLTQEADGGENA